MPKLKLTKRNIDSETHVPAIEAGRVDYFDEDLKGLFLRVGKDSKVFYVQVDVKDAATGKFKTVKEKIGAYGVTGNLKEAFSWPFEIVSSSVVPFSS